MTFTRLLGGAALAAMLTTTAMAQETPSPEKLALAKQMVEASGGTKQVDALLGVMFNSISANMQASVPAEQQRLTTILLQKMQARIEAIVPQMIDATVQVYAKDMTEKELRDYVAWMQSDTAQAMARKTPQMMQETMQVLMPLMSQVTQGMKQDVLDEACQQANCSAHDREVMAAAMAKAMPAQPGANRPG